MGSDEPPRESLYDWNGERARPAHAFDLFDETLRDGLQSTSVVSPSLDEKLALVEHMEEVGIAAADIGLPGAGAAMLEDVVAIARHADAKKLRLALACAARTVPADLARVVEASQRSGRALAVYAFIGSSRIRQWVERWDRAFLLRTSREAIAFAVREGLEVAFVTEDTTRAAPDDLEPLFANALDAGARRIVLCDTVGHAAPSGARALVGFTRDLLVRLGRPDATIDWHGHDDRGLGVANALAALDAGAHRIHGCALGIGERVGNTSIDQVLVNLKAMGWWGTDLGRLGAYVTAVSEACRIPVPPHYPVFGRDAAVRLRRRSGACYQRPDP
jgi:2-isopropylmalate synthase